ncbi:hypothetical protein BUALT_Bualt02G0171300 [Buddleja alternifolia]|uniref:GDSL esterase/lipase n=1 Tax=Buddleja alternifolia TaxID=168488 RepID=A0AAV6Y0X7_9LAMI|nr:hypothetical protein BUALT_Bualt02G0171300 [Buddleja alternifolia]
MAIRNWVNDIVPSLMILMMIPIRNCPVSAMEMGLSSDLMSSAVTAMYVLGDSSVDCGDNTPFYSLSHRNLSLFPCNGSDTTLLPQLLGTLSLSLSLPFLNLTKKMGLPYTIPFYSQNGSIHEILGGVNFGSAEATILYPDGRSYQSLNQQLRQAFETIQLLQLQLGEETANNFVKSSLFYLSFGKDDFIDHFLNNSSGIGVNYSGSEFSHILARQMTNAIRNLYANNVRKIVCAGVLPLGCAPRILLKSDNSSDCLDEVNMLVLEYNRELEENIVAVNAELPGAHIIYCDAYRAIMEFINNPKAYGIEDVKNACCGLGRYGGVSGCLSIEMACPDASTRLWWDLYNPTPTVDSLLADSAWSGQPLADICRPITVQQLRSSSL